MPETISPGVVLASKYVFSKDKYSQYINYIDRSAAVRSQAYSLYSVFADYMDNPSKRSPGFQSERASALFTATKDQLSTDEVLELKKQFSTAQKNDSPMWQQVISFRNDFLEQYGLYDRKTGLLDEDRLRFATRAAMQGMLKDEKMDGAAVWSAAFHYNTDNIHVHIAIVEPHPTRTRKEFSVCNKDGVQKKQVQFKGNINKKTFVKMKSKVINNIIDRTPELTKINDIIRNDIVAEKRNRTSSRDRKLRGAFLNLYSLLPADRRMWNYKMNALNSVRPEIDRFTKTYIELYHHKDYDNLIASLDKQEAFLQSIYGSGKQKLYQQYKESKTTELYTRMGNAVLRDLREYDKAEKKNLHSGRKTARDRLLKQKRRVRNRTEGVYNLRKALQRDFESARNQTVYNQLQCEIENEQEPDGR